MKSLILMVMLAGTALPTAAYNQSVIQKRPSGSLMAGAMYFHSSTEYDNDLNADMIMRMNIDARLSISMGG